MSPSTACIDVVHLEVEEREVGRLVVGLGVDERRAVLGVVERQQVLTETLCPQPQRLPVELLGLRQVAHGEAAEGLAVPEHTRILPHRLKAAAFRVERPRKAIAMPATDAISSQPTPAHELKTLVLSRHALICIETSEEARVDTLAREVASKLGIAVFDWTVTRGLVRDGETAASYGTQDASTLARTLGELSVDALFVLKDIGPHLASPAAARALRETVEKFAMPGRLSTLVCTGANIALPADLEALALHFQLGPPDVAELRRVVFAVMDLVRDSGRAQVDLTSDDVDALAEALRGMTLNQARQARGARGAARRQAHSRGPGPRDRAQGGRGSRRAGCSSTSLPPTTPPRSAASAAFASGSTAPRSASAARRPHSASTHRAGMLLVGVQGCGKSLAAKAVARRMAAAAAQARRRQPLRQVHRRDRAQLPARHRPKPSRWLPCVLWIDEIEKAFASSGGDDGGVSRRVFGSFLTWLAEKEPGVFVVATANDLSSIPPELMRKGRFDEIFFVDLPDAAEREEIFAIHLRLRRQDPETFDLHRLAAASEGFSGAEIEQAVITGLYAALHAGEPPDVGRIEAELAATVPLSVSRAEDVARLREIARERFVPVR